MEKKDLSFLLLSEDYLHTARMIFTELKSSGNKCVVVSDREITPEILEEETKWSDYNVLIPGLFLFYHGLELILKGLLSLKGHKVEGHGIEKLYMEFSKAFNGEKEILSIIKKYAYINKDSSELIKKLVAENPDINSTQKLYQAFRYPSSIEMGDNHYDYYPILYKGEDILDTIDEFIKDNENIMIEAVRISRIFE